MKLHEHAAQMADALRITLESLERHKAQNMDGDIDACRQDFSDDIMICRAALKSWECHNAPAQQQPSLPL